MGTVHCPTSPASEPSWPRAVLGAGVPFRLWDKLTVVSRTSRCFLLTSVSHEFSEAVGSGSGCTLKSLGSRKNTMKTQLQAPRFWLSLRRDLLISAFKNLP